RTSIPLTLNPRAGGLPPAFSFSLEVRRVVVMSYNIHHGVGCDGILDLERIAGAIESASPDAVGLHEVDGRFHRRSGRAGRPGWAWRAVLAPPSSGEEGGSLLPADTAMLCSRRIRSSIINRSPFPRISVNPGGFWWRTWSGRGGWRA